MRGVAGATSRMVRTVPDDLIDAVIDGLLWVLRTCLAQNRCAKHSLRDFAMRFRVFMMICLPC